MASTPDSSKRYRFRSSEPLPQGARRIARGLLDDAVGLADDDSRDLGLRVHYCRKAIKSLRALVRLLRPCLNDAAAFGQANDELRAVNHLLSGFRDALVVKETLETLSLPAHLSRDIPLSQRLLSDTHEDDHGGRPASAERAALDSFARALERFHGAVDHWTFKETQNEALRDGYRHTADQCRERMQDAFLSGEAEAFHHWRRAAKRYYLQTQLLQAVFTQAGGNRLGVADDLQDNLGRHHDLAVLRERLPVLHGHVGPALFAALGITIAVDMAAIESECADLGEMLFDHRPDHRRGPAPDQDFHFSL